MTASRRFTSVAAIAASVLFLICWRGADTGPLNQDQIIDIPVYETYGNAIEIGKVPYRDFRLEYPPGALPMFALPALMSEDWNGSAFRDSFEDLMLFLGIVTIASAAILLVGLGATRSRVVAALISIAVFPLLLGSVVFTRFDLWPAALTVSSLAALTWRRDRLGFGVLGLAVAAKLYPAVLVPLGLSYVWRRRGRREALLCLGVLVGVVALVFLPFVALGADGVVYSLGRQLSRPLQIESLASAFFLAAHQVAGLEITMSSGHGSQNLDGVAPGIAAVVLSIVQIAVLVWIWLRLPGTAEQLLRWSAAALVAFVTLGKVLSPQFLIWLAPVVPLVAGRRGARAAILLAAAMVLTQLWFPSRYWELVLAFDPLPSWLVLVRDLVLVALLVVLVSAFRDRGRAPARSP